MSGGGESWVLPVGRWLAATAVVTIVHLGGLVLALRQPDVPPPDEDTAGAFSIDLAPLATATPTPPVEHPAGPPQVESAEVAASVASVVPPPLLQPELPPLPELAAAPPDLLLPKAVDKPPEPPREEPSAVPPQPTAAVSEASTASLASAPPPPDAAPNAAKTAAPNAGVSDRNRLIKARWESAISAHLARHARFPAGVEAAAQERQTIVRFRLDRTGRVIELNVVATSGSGPLDREAEAMIRRASPLPLPPAQVEGSALEFVVPVRFKASRR